LADGNREMKKELLDYLVCPMCNDKLELYVTKLSDDEIMEGYLECNYCRNKYLIVDCIPDLIPPIGRNFSTNDKWEKHQVAEEYHQSHSRPKSDDFQEYFCDFFSIKKSTFDNQVCMEIGCGITGAIHYLDNAKYTIGIDPLCSQCKQLYSLENTQATPHITGVGEHLPIKSNSIDSVFIYGVLDHCINPEKVMKEASRVLKNGGRIYIRVYTFSLPKTVREKLNIVDIHPHHLSRREVLESAFRYGLKIDKIHSVKVPFTDAWTRYKTGTTVSAMKYVGATLLGIEELALILAKG
jgi:uncharacterized protein YbaR (Trm112 family)